MKIDIQITNDDYLVHQLYTASNSLSVKKKRRISKWVSPAIFLIIGGVLTYQDGDFVALILFGSLAVIWFAFYPKYERYRYKRHYKNYIKELHGKDVIMNASIVFDEGYIFVKDEVSEGKVKISEVNYVANLPKHYIVRVSNKQALVIPKICVQSTNDFEQFFTSMQIEVKDELDWKWK